MMQSTDDLYGVYGASGYGREVLPLLRAELVRQGVEASCLVFVDDKVPSGVPEILHGHALLSYRDFLARPARQRFMTVAIADGAIRQTLMETCGADGVGLLSVRAANVVVLDEVVVGEGSILSPFVTLTSDIHIGKGFQANIYSYVGHDCRLGDYVTFAPSVKCNGNVEIGNHVYIGTGAILKQGRPGRPLTIGDGAVIGAGSVVMKSVPAGMTVFGNPAVELTKENLKRRS